jgi:hypothetical protein
MEFSGEPGECVGRWDEAMAGARSGSFELRCGKNAQSAGVAGGQMLLDFLPLGEWKFAVDQGVEFF